jgi:HEAT repeat protein
VEALGKLGPAAAPALPALIEACQDADAGVRALAIRALGPFAQGAPAQASLRQALQDADPQARLAAVNACGATDVLEEATRLQLVDLLEDPNDVVKIEAARVITKANGAEPELLARLTRLVIEDDNVWVQEQAAAILGSLGAVAAAAGPGLVQAVENQESSVREAALKALAQIQPPEAAVAFIAGLKDDSPDLRKMASAGWRKAAAIPDEALPGLVEALHDPQIQVRANAAFALGRLEALPREAVPLLLDCTKDPNDELRLNAVLALQKITTKDVQEVFGRLVRDPTPRIRLLAAGSLLSADPAHEEAQNVVAEALTHDSSTLRKSALGLIQTLGAGGVAWLSALRERQVVEEDDEMRAGLRGLIAKLADSPNTPTPLPAVEWLGKR